MFYVFPDTCRTFNPSLKRRPVGAGINLDGERSCDPVPSQPPCSFPLLTQRRAPRVPNSTILSSTASRRSSPSTTAPRRRSRTPRSSRRSPGRTSRPPWRHSCRRCPHEFFSTTKRKHLVVLRTCAEDCCAFVVVVVLIEQCVRNMEYYEVCAHSSKMPILTR